MNNIEQWFVDRQLYHKPIHFVTARTPVTKESLSWIAHNLVGRYYLGTEMEDFVSVSLVAFEDNAEAMLYELTWS